MIQKRVLCIKIFDIITIVYWDETEVKKLYVVY